MRRAKVHNEDMVRKAYAYLRVSSEEQVSNFSLDNQLDYCNREALRLGYTLIKVYREEGASAKTTNRPQLLQMIEDCRKNRSEISALFIYKIDRLSRETSDYLAIKKMLADYGVRIVSVTEPLEDSPVGVFLETMLAANAQLDNGIKSVRTIDGLKKRLEQGLPLGKAPVGYINATRDERQITEPDPQQFGLVKKAWEEMATGAYSLSTIVPFMNKLGIQIKIGKRRLPITRSQQTHRIFRDKFYAGYIVSRKYGVDKRGIHQPMISEELFYNVQAIINKRSFTANIKHNRQNKDFPLRGVICAECGQPMTGSWSKGRSNKYAYYYCNRGNHKSPSIPKNTFETLFLELLKSIEPKPELVALFSEMVKEKWKSRYSHIAIKQKTVDDELKALYEYRKKLVEGHLKGTYSDEIFKEQLAIIENEMLVKKTVQNEANLEKIDIDVIVNFMNTFLCNISKAWEHGNLSQRKVLLGSIFPKNIVFDYHGFRTAELGLPFKLIQEFNTPGISRWVMYRIRTGDLQLHKLAL